MSWVRLRGPVIQANGSLTIEDALSRHEVRRSAMLHFNERQRPH